MDGCAAEGRGLCEEGIACVLVAVGVRGEVSGEEGDCEVRIGLRVSEEG